MIQKRFLVFLSWVVSLLLLNVIEECWGGMVIEELHRDIEGRMGRIVRYFTDDRFRTDHIEGKVSTIIDFRGDRMVMIDHSSRSYVEIPFSRWEKEVTAKLKQAVPDIPPRERRIVVKRTGDKAIINGFQTEKIEILADGELIEENWMTRDVDFREVERVMEKVARSFVKEFKSEMKEGREIYEKLRSHGLPILVKDYTLSYGLGGITVMEVQKIEKKDLGEEIFLSPSGYQRIMFEVPKR